LIGRDSERKEDLLLKFPGAAPGSRVGFHSFNYIRYNDICTSQKERLESWKFGRRKNQRLYFARS